jgi:hypothetical protein
MKTPQHLFALTRPEQRVVLLIVLGLVFAAAFSHYRKIDGKPAQPVEIQGKPDSKPPADENSQEE